MTTFDLKSPRGWLVLLICCSSLFIVSLDNTALQIALPTIQQQFGVPMSGLQWIIDAYTLVLASFLLLAGSMADRFGRRRVFTLGLVVFTLGSLLCSVSQNLSTLVAFRVLQALGGAMLNPVALSIITHTFPGRRDRARAIGVWGSVVGLAMAAGPLLGGVLVGAFGWQSIFWLNVPVGLTTVILTRRFIPESRAEVPRRPDLVGQVLVIATLATLVAAIIYAPDHGWNTTTQVCAGAAVACGVALLVHELRRDEPLIEVRLFRSVSFTGASINALVSFSTLGGFLLLTTVYLQDVAHLSALEAGLWLLPMAVMVLVSAPVAGRLTGTVGPRIPLSVAGVAFMITGVLFGPFHGQTASATLVIGSAVFGLGFGFVNAPITNTAVSGLPVSRAGVASGLASTFRQTGAALGTAIIGSVLAAGIGNHSYEDAFVAAASPAWLVIAASGLIVVVVAQLTTKTADRGHRETGAPGEVRPSRDMSTRRA